MTAKDATQAMNMEVEVFLQIHDKLRTINEKIETIRFKARDAKTPHYSGMPHGAPVETSPLESYIERLEDLMQKKGKIELELKLRWNAMKKQLLECEVPQDGITLMYYRCYHGKKWKDCTELMKHDTGKWSENKTFSTYRAIAQVVQNRKEIFV